MGHKTDVTSFEAGWKVFTDYLTCFETDLDGTNG